MPLAHQTIDFSAEPSLAAAYAARLLRDLGAASVDVGSGNGDDVVRDWAQSGLMYLCGEAAGQPALGPANLASCARGAMRAFAALVPQAAELDGTQLLVERASLLGLRAGGQVSANGSCHLLSTRDGWIALNLPRPDDWALLPAWLQLADFHPDWRKVAAEVSTRSSVDVVARGRLMGLAVTALGDATSAEPAWFVVHQQGLEGAARHPNATPLVLDLSSLWAGPLCSHLLQIAGARVIKVESTARPDGARRGSADFYNLINAGKRSLALDLTAEQGRHQLLELIQRADIVIEGSRPRVLRQWGIDANALVRENPGLTWIGISGYGRSEPEADWVAFGDDAAVAARLVSGSISAPCFCGDALPDPLLGIHAALAALAFWRCGSGVLLDMSLSNVSAYIAGLENIYPVDNMNINGGELLSVVSGYSHPILQPSHRPVLERAAALGADTSAILKEFSISC